MNKSNHNSMNPVSAYRDYLDMPKLVVVSASDDVFMPDATKFWFDKMPGDNKLWYNIY